MTNDRDVAVAPAQASRLDVQLGREDSHRVLSLLGLGTAVVAGSLAVFGLPKYSFHGPLHAMGIMDPLCGGTRAIRLAMRGDFVGSWTYNPAGVIVAIAAVLLVARLAVGLVSGRWLNAEWSPSRGQRRLLLAILIVVLVLLQIRQQSIAESLMTP